MSNKSEPARVRELATQLIKLHGETANTYGDDALWYSAAALRRCANRCENTHPAPPLTAELREELLEALNAAMRSGRKAGWWDSNESTMDKIQAAITKLTNLECGS